VSQPPIAPVAPVAPTERIVAALRAHPRRLALLVLLVGALVIGPMLRDAVPRDVHLRYAFGPEHATVREAAVTFVLDGAEVHAARFTRRDGFPDRLDHEVSLAPGRYRVEATLRADGSVRRVERLLRVPSDGVVLLDLYERPR
jgi:hypothetical protein